MPPSPPSQLIERLLLKSWRRRLTTVCLKSSESLLLMVFFVVVIVGVDVLAVKSFNGFLVGQTEMVDILIRSLGPLLFGISALVVWVLFMMVANSNPPSGLMSLPFRPMDWQQAMTRLIYYCASAILALLVGPYIVVLVMHTHLGWVANGDFTAQAVLLVITGSVAGALVARVNNAVAHVVHRRHPILARWLRYMVFMSVQLLAIVVFVKWVLLVPLTQPVALWVPGAQLSRLYNELHANHLMAALAYVLLSVLAVQVGLWLRRSVDHRLPERYWYEEPVMRAKSTWKLPEDLTAYHATVRATLTAISRDAESWLMTLVTLMIPIALGVVLRLSGRPDLGNMYAQITWIIVPLAAANLALLMRAKLGSTRLAIYTKPITPVIVTLSQLLVVGTMGLTIGLSGLAVCAHLAGMSLGDGEIRQFAFSTVGASLLAFTIGVYLNETNRAMTMLTAGTVYFVALLPYLALNQWLISKVVMVQVSVSLLVLWILGFAALYGERQRLSL